MAGRPNPKLVYHASDMVLKVQSDASHDSLPGSGSMAGGFFYFGWKDNDKLINHPVLCICTRIEIICPAAAEAEYAAAFKCGQEAMSLRYKLDDIRLPQDGPTVIKSDNTTAIGLAQDTVKPKRSKYFDRRWNWLKEKCANADLKLEKIAGNINLADFFTKVLPAKTHIAHIPFLEKHDVDPNNVYQTRTYKRTAMYKSMQKAKKLSQQ
jgi:hypothetical protein